MIYVHHETAMLPIKSNRQSIMVIHISYGIINTIRLHIPIKYMELLTTNGTYTTLKNNPNIEKHIAFKRRLTKRLEPPPRAAAITIHRITVGVMSLANKAKYKHDSTCQGLQERPRYQLPIASIRPATAQHTKTRTYRACPKQAAKHLQEKKTCYLAR